ncbi:flagellar basal body rod protein FlgC [Cognatishimia sp. WU-CL00825]|uniref:flagellar basal body rod protein FlgC n=1 Tax=Cognatishimia sp. WU-CL00825 TaxID=3127658 RepID=UPI0031038E76
MSDFSKTLGVTASGLQAQAARLRHLSENIANADTPGYRRKTVAFLPRGQGVELGRVSLDPSTGVQHFDPSHPLAGPGGYYEGSNVNLIIEIADAREAQRSYEANLKIFDQTRQMSSALLDLLRR